DGAARAVGFAVAVIHVGIGEGDDLTRPGDRTQLDHALARLGAIAAGVHVEGTADAAGNAAGEGQPVYARLGRRGRHLDVGQRRADAQPAAVEHLDAAKALGRQPDDDTIEPAFADQEVRAEPDRRDADVLWQMTEEKGEVGLVR